MFNVSVNNINRVAPGYLFVAPYDCLDCRSQTTSFVQQQIGPHIYDQHGVCTRSPACSHLPYLTSCHQQELVWSGSNVFRDTPVFDFKVTTIEGRQHLTCLAGASSSTTIRQGGFGYIIDESLQHTAKVSIHRATPDMHEFTVLEDGASALLSVSNQRLIGQNRTIQDSGFQEIDVRSNTVQFGWWAADHISPTESLFGDDMTDIL